MTEHTAKRGPGRPRKHPAPVVEHEPEPELAPAPVSPPPAPSYICQMCYPDGWPAGWTGISCEHGIWTRRL